MFELVLQAPEALVESVSDALMEELDALSVSVEDSDADTAAEHALFGEPGMPPPSAGWERSTLKALFETEDAASDAATLLLAQEWATVAGSSVSITALHEVAEQDWVRLTQSQFDPVEITPEFWIVPTWHEPPAAATRVIRLDPGMAFGTGTHPTTRMCLGWIAAHAGEIAGGRVLDYGCGSGILAILAKKCGANPVYGIDIDPQAVESARHNSERNRADVTYGLPEDCPAGEFDIVVANILSNPLKLMASMLSSKVKAGGRLALSGILARQAEEVARVYQQWIDIAVWREHEGWVCLTGTRR
jgi:ribosomal protein L11 methyltransferase